MAKLIIAGLPGSPEVASLAQAVQAKTGLKIAPVFSTMTRLEPGKKTYYIPESEAELSFRNDSFMWVFSNEWETRGVTLDDMYTHGIFTLSFAELNNMSQPALAKFYKEDGVICFMDTVKKNSTIDRLEAMASLQRVAGTDYLYFTDHDTVDDASEMIACYLSGDKETRLSILAELF